MGDWQQAQRKINDFLNAAVVLMVKEPSVPMGFSRTQGVAGDGRVPGW
jgi:hypothetical protein